ncbi:hypothetical protein F4778DRAFT_545147 [Xylariomycetidae sp. FL2044]|nr:hypothetical protein F4778DRAFT_545147 [Xylariomycetidae sp. FL2044]
MTVSTEKPMAPPADRKSILLVNASQYLHGLPASDVITADWSRDDNDSRQHADKFDTVGFNTDPSDVDKTLADLETVLRERRWDGVLVGWCLRGSTKFTQLFEGVVQTAFAAAHRQRKQQKTDPDQGLRLMFCDGPNDVVRTTIRNFPNV